MTKLWECPHCMTELDEQGVINMMKKIDLWLTDRPSASLDASFEKRERLVNISRELKKSFILTSRRPSSMMQSQNVAASNDLDEQK